MKKLTLILTIVILLTFSIFAKQSDIKMRMNYGAENADLLSILQFEDINMEKVSFTGEDLKDKHFVISIKEFTNGKLVKDKLAIDSNELGDYGKIKGNTFNFRALTRRTVNNLAKFEFQFNGFSNRQEFKIDETYRGFAMKNFLGAQTETAVPVGERAYILTFMMPYMKPDGSGAYCEVAQSGANPEEFGTKYKIPTYFLIDIKFQ